MREYRNSFIGSVAKIVKQVLVDLEMYSDDAMDLVMRTGAVESGFRELEQQSENSPAVGFWQVEEPTAYDIWDNYLKNRPKSLIPQFLIATRVGEGPWPRHVIMYNIALQVALCRLKYRRDPNPIPKTAEAQAEYWLRVYNGGGKGTIDKFLKAIEWLEGDHGQDNQ